MPTDRPHVVLLMADHLRRDSLGCYGDRAVATPNLDRLAEECVVFDHAYCATPLCTPTRVSMYTGKHAHTHGAIVNGHHYPEEKPFATAGPQHGTLYEALAAAGYGIAHVGIQHCQTDPPLEERVPEADVVGWPEYGEYAKEHGFVGNSWSRVPLCPRLEWKGGRPRVEMGAGPRRSLFPFDAEHYMDAYFSRLAEERIGRLDLSQPQFFEALFWAPHPPLELPEPYYSMYPPEDIELPETVGVWCKGQPGSLLIQTCGQVGAHALREEYREAWSGYYGLVTMVDECLGRVIDALKARGIWDDALVIFTQDHGDLMGCHQLMQKNCFYEEAAALPLMVKPPGGAGGRRGQLVSAIDFCPSVCDYAGADAPEGVQGRSWRQAVEEPDAAWRDAVFLEYNGDQGRNAWPQRGVVLHGEGGRWKYIATRGDVHELYDLAADPHETRSLIDSPEHQEVCDRLRARLADWMRTTEDPITPEEMALA